MCISGFFGPDAIRPFDSVNVENDLAANKFKTKDLIFAVEQALQGNKKRKKLVQQVDETAISENPKRRVSYTKLLVINKQIKKKT
jgi:hypothetical protein